MADVEALQRKLFAFPASLALWALAAAAAGCCLALMGLVGVYVSAVAALIIVFGAVAAKFPAFALATGVCFLGLVPFNFGLQTGVLPKIFGDETPLLLYLVALPFIFIFTRRAWRHGFIGLYAVLALLLGTHALSFGAPTDLVAFRNFLETYVLGAMLLVLFLQEASNINLETMGEVVFGLAAVIAALSVLERITLRNPIMEMQNDIKYLSPELARITEGVYRPYVTFFHPSEAATFMALGVPFVVRSWMRRKSWLAFLAIFTVAAGLFVNATRGVWVALLVVALVSFKNVRAVLFGAIPIAVIGGWIGYFSFENTPFVRRLADPSDLYSRLESWKIAWRIFVAHPLIGVGNMQFQKVYLDYIRDLSNLSHLDLILVHVGDNMYLTTLVEHGLLGFVALAFFLAVVGLLLRRYRLLLNSHGFNTQAAFVRCSELALIVYIVTGCFADVHQFTKATKYIFILAGLGLGAGVCYMSADREMLRAAASPEPQAQEV
jgi:hypothetical protein